MVKIMNEMVKEGGIANLYPGWLPRVMRKSIIGALTWVLFEKASGGSIHK